jgi:hypothetical protein
MMGFLSNRHLIPGAMSGESGAPSRPRIVMEDGSCLNTKLVLPLSRRMARNGLRGGPEGKRRIA